MRTQTELVNHERIQPRVPGLEVFLCRCDTIRDWNFVEKVRPTPYWRMDVPLNARGTVIYKGEPIALEVGKVYLFAPETIFATRGDDFDMFYLHFSLDEEFELYQDALFTFADDTLNTMIADAGRELTARNNSRQLDMKIIAIVYRALGLLPDVSDGSAAGSDFQMLKIIRMLHREPWRNFGNEELAAAVNMSVSAFIRKFTLLFGISPRHYVLEEKIKLAASLLAGSELSIAEIAAETGFGNRYYFSKMFMKYRGASPAAYRKRNGAATPK